MLKVISAFRRAGLGVLLAGAATAAVPSSAPANPPDAGTALAWAEWKFPALFPAGPASQPLAYLGVNYTVRIYGTGNLIGISDSGDVVGYGPFTGFAVLPLGTLATLAPAINPDICSFRPTACPGTTAPTPGRLSVAGASPGHSYVLALLADDSVVGWSLDDKDPRAGSGARLPGTVSARHVGISAKAIAAGPKQALALGTDGIVRGWGFGGGGTIIGGATTSIDLRIATPVPTTFPDQITSIGLIGIDYALAVRADGTVWHLPGTTAPLSSGQSRNDARQVEGLTGVRSVRSVVGSSSRRGIVVGHSGTVWEITMERAVGGYRGVPAVVAGLPPAADAVCHARHCLALATDGSVWSWGQNVNGALGTGAAASTAVSAPAQVPGLSGVVAISAGEDSSHAITADGRLWNWGRAAAAGMGQVSGALLRPTVLPGLDQIREISVGSAVLVRRADGSVWGWGPNYTDELGVGLMVYSSTPVQAKLINLN